MASSVSEMTADPVFDRSWWIYSLCRERLFADHTETIATALLPLLQSRRPIRLLEVGCGPGFYSRRLAARFPWLETTGIDTSERLLTHARRQAHRANLDNCSFLHADAHNLPASLAVADAAIASRFFLIVPQRHRMLSAIFDTIRPGGIFFVAEPISPLRTAVPLWLMRALDLFRGRGSQHSTVRCDVLSHSQFQDLIGSQPWSKVRIWQDKRYRYALCEKAAA